MPREALYVGDHDARLRRRRLLITAILAAVLIAATSYVAWRNAVDSADGTAEDLPAAANPALPRETTITEDADVVAEAVRSAQGEWRERVTAVSVTTILRRPVVTVQTDLPGEEAQAVEELSFDVSSLADGLGTALGMPRTYYIRILSAEGDLVGALAFTDARWALDTPPAPADAVALTAWLEQVYAQPREPWLEAVRNIRGPEGDPEGALVVETSLDPAKPADLVLAQTIFDAVNSSGATFAPFIRLTFADPTFEWTAVMDGVDPYGP